jgi:hypothetical protein
MSEPSRFAPFVGRASEPRQYHLEHGHIQRFAEAIGDADPRYADEATLAPPTFAIALRPNDVRAGIDIDWRKLLHGEQELTFSRGLRAGDRVSVVQTIAGADVKHTKSGIMDVMVLETRGTDAGGAEVFCARSTILVRR